MITSLCTQIPLELPETCQKLEQLLELHPEAWRPEKTTERRILIKKQPDDYCFVPEYCSWFPVRVNQAGDPVQERVLESYEYLKEQGGVEAFEALQEVAYRAIKALACSMCWQEKTLSMAMTIAQHHQLPLNQESPPIRWHRDSGKYTLVLLLSNSSQWSGGEFFFRLRDSADNVSEAEEFEAKQGAALIFCNEGTQHCLYPIASKVDLATRTILTLHVSQDPDSE